MTKDQKLNYASQRLSRRVLSVPDKADEDAEDIQNKATDGEEGVQTSDFGDKALRAITDMVGLSVSC